MRRIVTPATLIGIAALVSCGPSPEPAADTGTTPEYEVGRLLRSYEPTLAEDDLELFLPQDLAVRDGRVFIAEAGNDRVTVTDTDLVPLARMGGSGDGPGELRVPTRIEMLTSGHMAVTEYSGGRISFFDGDGRYTHSIPYTLPQASPAVLDAESLVVTGPGGAEPRALRVGRGGVEVFAGRGGAAHDPEALAGDLGTGVTVRGEPGVLLIRDEAYTLELFDVHGALLRQDTLPGDVREALAGRLRRSERSWGGALRSATLLRPPTRLDDGRALLFLALDDPFALLYDPETGGFQALRTPPEGPARQILAGAFAGDIEGDELYVLSGEGVYVFELSTARP